MQKHAALLAIVATASVLTVALGGCTKCSPDERREDGTGAGGDADTSDAENLAPLIVTDAAARRPSRSADPQAEQAWLDGGVDPACTGATIELATALADRRCATNAATAKALRAAIEADAKLAGALKQEAKRGADGRLEVWLVNGGAKPVTVPLSWHPKIPAFVVLADNPNENVLYELETPRLEVGRAEDGDAGAAGARFARVVLPPSGRAVARITIEPKVVKRVDRKVVDGGAPAAPARLAPGKWTLHVGQLVTDVETGEPATIAWDVAP